MIKSYRNCNLRLQKDTAAQAATAARHQQSRHTPRLKRYSMRRLSASDHIRRVVNECSQTLRVTCAASPQPDWRRLIHSLPVSRRREDAVRLLSVERLHHGI